VHLRICAESRVALGPMLEHLRVNRSDSAGTSNAAVLRVMKMRGILKATAMNIRVILNLKAIVLGNLTLADAYG
jgi:hypothetical protein